MTDPTPMSRTERDLREAVMTTPAGRKWRERYLKQLEARRLKEAAIATRKPTKQKPSCEVCSLVGQANCTVHGAEVDVPTKSFVSTSAVLKCCFV